MVKISWCLFAISLVCITACFYANPGYQVIENPEVLDYALHHLPHRGTLTRHADGYVYLKVPNDYINALFPRLHAKGFHKPPYFRRPNAPGAHISVIYSDELRHKYITEVGKVFTFTPTKLALIRGKGRTHYIVLEVEAPELEALRQKYGLRPKLKGHEFHITLAKRGRNY